MDDLQRRLEQNLARQSLGPATSRPLIADLTLELGNGYLSVWEVNVKCVQLKNYPSFGLIIPREFLGNISVPYELQEMNFDEIPDDHPAKSLYQATDSVMIKSRGFK